MDYIDIEPHFIPLKNCHLEGMQLIFRHGAMWISCLIDGLKLAIDFGFVAPKMEDGSILNYPAW